MPLREICRSKLRITLRNVIESENSNLKFKDTFKERVANNKTRNSQPNRRKNTRRCTRRIVIPIFEESDTTSDDNNSNVGQKDQPVNQTTNSFFGRSVAAAASSLTAVFQRRSPFNGDDSSNSESIDSGTADESVTAQLESVFQKMKDSSDDEGKPVNDDKMTLSTSDNMPSQGKGEANECNDATDDLNNDNHMDVEEESKDDTVDRPKRSISITGKL